MAFLMLGALLPVATAQEDAPHLDVPFVEPDVRLVADGALDEPEWQDAAHEQVTLDSAHGEERFAHLYMIHNGTWLFIAVVLEYGDGLRLQIDPVADGANRGQFLDAIDVGADGTTQDMQWTVDGRQWASDDDSDRGCGGNITAAVATEDALTTYEIAKPFEGDACDARLLDGSNAGLRLTVREGGDTYRWPAGSVDEDGEGDSDRDGDLSDERADWGGFLITSRFEEDTGEDVQPGEEDWTRDPDRETQEQEGVETDRPIGVPRDDPGGAYEPQETPAPGLALFALLGLIALAFVSARRR